MSRLDWITCMHIWVGTWWFGGHGVRVVRVCMHIRIGTSSSLFVSWHAPCAGAATKPKPLTGQAAKEEATRLKGELYQITKNKQNGLKASEAETKQVLDLAERLNKLNQVRRCLWLI